LIKQRRRAKKMEEWKNVSNISEANRCFMAYFLPCGRLAIASFAIMCDGVQLYFIFVALQPLNHLNQMTIVDGQRRSFYLVSMQKIGTLKHPLWQYGCISDWGGSGTEYEWLWGVVRPTQRIVWMSECSWETMTKREKRRSTGFSANTVNSSSELSGSVLWVTC